MDIHRTDLCYVGLRVAGFNIRKDFEFSQYPTKMHLTAFGSDFRLSSSGTGVNTGEPKVLKYETPVLYSLQRSKGVTSLLLVIVRFSS
jgi:hypothetical protein